MSIITITENEHLRPVTDDDNFIVYFNDSPYTAPTNFGYISKTEGDNYFMLMFSKEIEPSNSDIITIDNISSALSYDYIYVVVYFAIGYNSVNYNKCKINIFNSPYKYIHPLIKLKGVGASTIDCQTIKINVNFTYAYLTSEYIRYNALNKLCHTNNDYAPLVYIDYNKLLYYPCVITNNINIVDEFRFINLMDSLDQMSIYDSSYSLYICFMNIPDTDMDISNLYIISNKLDIGVNQNRFGIRSDKINLKKGEDNKIKYITTKETNRADTDYITIIKMSNNSRLNIVYNFADINKTPYSKTILNDETLQYIINEGDKPYIVKFYDENKNIYQIFDNLNTDGIQKLKHFNKFVITSLNDKDNVAISYYNHTENDYIYVYTNGYFTHATNNNIKYKGISYRIPYYKDNKYIFMSRFKNTLYIRDNYQVNNMDVITLSDRDITTKYIIYINGLMESFTHELNNEYKYLFTTNIPDNFDNYNYIIIIKNLTNTDNKIMFSLFNISIQNEFNISNITTNLPTNYYIPIYIENIDYIKGAPTANQQLLFINYDSTPLNYSSDIMFINMNENNNYSKAASLTGIQNNCVQIYNKQPYNINRANTPAWFDNVISDAIGEITNYSLDNYTIKNKINNDILNKYIVYSNNDKHGLIEIKQSETDSQRMVIIHRIYNNGGLIYCLYFFNEDGEYEIIAFHGNVLSDVYTNICYGLVDFDTSKTFATDLFINRIRQNFHYAGDDARININGYSFRYYTTDNPDIFLIIL